MRRGWFSRTMAEKDAPRTRALAARVRRVWLVRRWARWDGLGGGAGVSGWP